MKKSDIKKLAQVSFDKGIVNKNVVDYVMDKLSKADLKLFLFFLTQEIDKNTVSVVSSHELTTQDKKRLENIFEKEVFNYKTDISLGAGIVIKSEDTIIDASIKGAVNQTINQLKQ